MLVCARRRRADERSRGQSTLLAMVEGRADEAGIEAALRSYFALLAPSAWPDAFAEYDLV